MQSNRPPYTNIIVQSLHWLLVCQRIHFEVLLLVYKHYMVSGLNTALIILYEESRPGRNSKKHEKKGKATRTCRCSVHGFTHLVRLCLIFLLCLFTSAINFYLTSHTLD